MVEKAKPTTITDIGSVDSEGEGASLIPKIPPSRITTGGPASAIACAKLNRWMLRFLTSTLSELSDRNGPYSTSKTAG